MLALADEHGVRYTGVIIENYEDDTDGTVKTTTDTERFRYFGNMLLHRGGELGYHGYNHQPLSLSDTDYGDVLPYKTWDSVDAMDRAVTELISFGTEMFPGTTMSVYVPPSNVLSEEGRALLASKYPQIRTIASNWRLSKSGWENSFTASLPLNGTTIAIFTVSVSATSVNNTYVSSVNIR